MPNSERAKELKHTEALARIWFVNHDYRDWPDDHKVWMEALTDLRAAARREAMEEVNRAPIAQWFRNCMYSGYTTHEEIAVQTVVLIHDLLRAKLEAPSVEQKAGER